MCVLVISYEECVLLCKDQHEMSRRMKLQVHQSKTINFAFFQLRVCSGKDLSLDSFLFDVSAV